MLDFKRFRPELVLLDINLPSYDGFYWCRQIRQESICPVIFISARTGEMDQVMALENGGDTWSISPVRAEINITGQMDQVIALENGGDDFITKPFQPDIVITRINSQLKRAY